jgi:hypothetical protein
MTVHAAPAMPIKMPKPDVIKLKMSIRFSCNIKLLISLFVPACDKAANGCKAQADKDIKEKIRYVEYASKCESAFFKKDKRKTRTGNIVSAGIHSQYGWQAAVREKMRGKKIGKDKDKESAYRSVEKCSGECHPVLLSL